MRLGLPRTHDSWLSKALSLGLNVPVDSAVEAFVRLFPGASMKVGLLRGVLFGGILPGVGIYSLGAAMKSGVSSLSSVKDLMPPISSFQTGWRRRQISFFQRMRFQKPFFRFETCCRCTESFKGTPFLGHHPGVSFLVRLLAEAASEFRFQGIHQLCVRFFRIRALPGLKVCSYRAFCSTGAKCCCGNQKKVLYPEHAHAPLYSRMSRKLQTKRRLHCLMKAPGVICLIPVGIIWRRSAWRPDPSIPCRP